MNPNHFILVKKKLMQEKEFSFYLIKLSLKRFFMKEFKRKIFTIAILLIFDETIVYLAFKFVLNKNRSG